MAFQVEASLLSVRIVLEGWPFGPRLFISFLFKERIMAQKCYRKMGNFLSTCPKASIKDDFKASLFWNLRFWSSRGFDRLEAIASLDAYRIINYQFLSKTHHFLLPDFQIIWEKVFKSGILWLITRAGMIKKFIRFFQKLCPSGHQGFLFKWFQGENECLLGLLTMTTNSFENPITKNLETFFLSFFCVDFMIMTFILLFRNVNKIHNFKRHPK